jgi:signal transduction histidine kinase
MIVQEAVRNAVVHGCAQNVQIRFWSVGDKIQLSIANDGKPFGSRRVINDGRGISIMNSRMELLGGTLRYVTGTGRFRVAVVCSFPRPVVP